LLICLHLFVVCSCLLFFFSVRVWGGGGGGGLGVVGGGGLEPHSRPHHAAPPGPGLPVRGPDGHVGQQLHPHRPAKS